MDPFEAYCDPKALRIEATRKTPFTHLSSTGLLIIKGMVFGDEGEHHFRKLHEWVSAYVREESRATTLIVSFDFLTGMPRKHFFEILKMLKARNTNLSVFWLVEDDDEHMLEMAEYMGKQVGISIQIILEESASGPYRS